MRSTAVSSHLPVSLIFCAWKRRTWWGVLGYKVRHPSDVSFSHLSVCNVVDSAAAASHYSLLIAAAVEAALGAILCITRCVCRLVLSLSSRSRSTIDALGIPAHTAVGAMYDRAVTDTPCNCWTSVHVALSTSESSDGGMWCIPPNSVPALAAPYLP